MTDSSEASGASVSKRHTALHHVGRVSSVLFALAVLATAVILIRRWPAPVPKEPAGPAVEKLAYSFSVPAGDSLPVSITVVYRGDGKSEQLIPIVLLLDEVGNELQEADGKPITLEAGTAPVEVKLLLPTRDMVPGSYFLAAILLDLAAKKKVGQGMYRQPVELKKPSP